MKSDIRVLAQYKENYNVGPEGINEYGDKKPHWKYKGSAEFLITDVADDTVMYSHEEDMAAALIGFCASHNNEMCEYEYISHEVIFSKPTIVDGEDFEKDLNGLMRTRHETKVL